MPIDTLEYLFYNIFAMGRQTSDPWFLIPAPASPTMPRALDPTLLSAMNSGSFNPIIRAWGVFEHNRTRPMTVLGFKMHLDKLELQCTNYSVTAPKVCLERGALIAGVEYTVFSSEYYVDRYEYELGTYFLHCQLLYPGVATLSIGAGSTYQSVINYVSESRTPVYIGTPAWLTYKVLPTGRAILMNTIQSVLPWLLQKRLIFLSDYDFTHTSWFAADDALAQASNYTFTTVETDLVSTFREYRRFLWRDQLNTVHYSDSSNYPIHNLGYLESTDSAPAFTLPTNPHNFMLGTKMRVPANLKYMTGDACTVNSTKMVLDVTEVFDRKSNPSWYMDLESLQFFHNTEGGALPSTIEAAAPYTPLNVSPFNSVLSASDNNVQAAFETLDDHTHLTIVTDVPIAAITGKYLAFDTVNSTLYVWDGTSWNAISGGSVTNPFFVLLEDGTSYLLLEDGSSKLELE